MKTLILGLAAAAAAALALPAAAQSWNGDYASQWGYSRYAFRDYPEFRGEIAHIRGEIREGVEEGWLDDDQARDMQWSLRRVQSEEAQEFREHGWRLPPNDREEIRSDLDRLDQSIDQARDEGGDNVWRQRY